MDIRRMTLDDLQLGLRLSAQAGWNQTETDWRRFLHLAPDGCFVAEWDEQPVATAAAFVFGPVGWIAMVLVDEAFRHRGIASRLVEHALQHLEGQGVRTVRLDATPLGRPVYERLGFLPQYSLVRMQATLSLRDEGADFRPLTASQVSGVCVLDLHITATPRQRLIQALHAERPEAAAVRFNESGVAAYALWRPGRRASQMGPAVAVAPWIGEAMLDQVLQQCPLGPVFVDIPTDNLAAIQWASSRSFTVQREFTRMYRGQRLADFPEQMWASSGPEKG